MDGRELASALDALGLDRKAAAEVLGINPRTLRRYISGELPVPMLVDLAVDGIRYRRTLDGNK